MRNVWLLLAVFCQLGCNQKPAATSTATAPSGSETATADIADSSETRRWFACDRENATKHLNAELTIPSVCHRSQQQIHLFADTPTLCDEHGNLQLHSARGSMKIACGANGSYNQSVSLKLNSPDADHVVLNVRCSWNMDQGSRCGTFDESITLLVGKSAQIEFADGAIVGVSWQDVER